MWTTRFNQDEQGLDPVPVPAPVPGSGPYVIDLGFVTLDLGPPVNRLFMDANRFLDVQLEKVQAGVNKTMAWVIPALVLGGGLVTYIATRAASRRR